MVAFSYYLNWLLLLAGSRAMDASTPTFPQIVELDMIFPRNATTYAPVPLMPIVFAIQNFRVAKPLFLRIIYTLYRLPISNARWSGEIWLGNTAYNSSDPYFVYRWSPKVNNTEGDWMLTWHWIAGNCSRIESSYKPVEINANVAAGNEIYFTTQNGTKQPDLVAATQDDTCDRSQAFTINMTELLDVPSVVNYFDYQPSCPVLSTITPTPNPCGAKIDDAAASSISYAIQTSACLGGWSPFVTCPPGAKLRSLATRAEQLLAGKLALLITILAWLVEIA